MRGVDHFYQVCLTYPFKKQMKWYRTIGYFLIESALINGFICYNWKQSKKITQRAFRNKDIQGLLENYEVKQSSVRFKNSTEITNNRLSQRHFPAMFKDKKKKKLCGMQHFSSKM